MRNWVIVFFLITNLIFASDGIVGSSPDSNLALTVKAIQSAKQKLAINIYELTSQDVSNALISAIQGGVSVDLLQEGQPVGGLSQEALNIQESILTAMDESGGNHHYYEMTGERKDRRFVYDHAKYIIVDNETLLIGSENYSPSGQPVNGVKGNRGWEILLNDTELVNKYAGIFSSDVRMEFNDIELLEARNKIQLQAMPLAGPGWVRLPSSRKRIAEKVRGQQYNVDDTLFVTSPDTSLAGITKFIQDSQTTLDIEQMTFALEWSGATAPTVKEVLKAARRGVKVRVLLNDEKAFSSSAKEKNRETIDYLNLIAEKEGLDLEGRIANLKKMKVKIIHNKGALSDGKRTLISSINWNQNSIKNNREAAVVVTSKGVNKYYASLFDKDWVASEPTRIVKKTP